MEVPAGGVDREIRRTLAAEEFERAGALEHGDRAHRPCRHADRRAHADRLPCLDRPTRVRVEDVAITAAVAHEESFVVAAGRERAFDQFDAGDRLAGIAWVLHTDAPGRGVGLRADDADVAAQVHEAVPHVMRREHGMGTVGRVLLAEAAEVDFHAGLRQRDRVVDPANIAPADQRQQRLQGLGLRHPASAKVPGPPQHARGDVEQAVA